MKSFEERKAEVCRRRKIIAKKRKKRNKILLCAAPVIIALGIAITVNFSDIFPLNSAKNESTDSNTLSTDTDLPMLEIGVPDGGYGYEGYFARDISELVNANPWNENISLAALPVFKVKNDTPENKLKELITATAEKLNLKDFGSFTNDGGAVSTDSESIKITATDTDIAVYFKKAEGLPKKYNFGYYASYKDMKKSAEYLKNKYSALFEGGKYILNLYGGDCDIYGRQTYHISFYRDSGDTVQKIINYNFYKTYFTPNDNGELEQISTDTPDLGDKIGNYPIITPDKAKELLYNGKYVTSAPGAIKKSDKTAQTELVYRFAPWEKYYIPYYRFLVAEESTGNESLEKQGFKCYCAYYVPAVQEKYIANMPLWNGAVN